MTMKSIGIICGIIAGGVIVGATIAINSKKLQELGNKVAIGSKKIIKSTQKNESNIDVNEVIDKAQKTLTDLQTIINTVASKQN